jgi:hypothetical protein
MFIILYTSLPCPATLSPSARRSRTSPPRQRWIAAQRLAAGDTLRMAAVMANTNAAVLSLLLAEDPEFQGLIEDCRAIHAMPREEWRARAEAFARDAAERAMVDGRVSTLNLCLKATGLLAGAAEDDEDDPDAWMDRLTDEEWAEYEALCDEAEEPAEAGDVCIAAKVEATAEPGLLSADRAAPATAELPCATSPLSGPVVAVAPVPTTDVLAAGNAVMAPANGAATGAAFSHSAFPKTVAGPDRLTSDTL